MVTQEKNENNLTINDDTNYNEDTSKDSLFSIDKKMILPKLFYFFFFFGNGALLPYMALHFKQMLLTPTEVGILMGLKPFISFIAVPLWGIVVDRSKKAKLILIISMVALCTSITMVSYIEAPEDAEKILALHCNKTDEHSWSPWVAQRDSIVNLPGKPSKYNDTFEFQRLFPKFYRYNGYPWPLDITLDQNETLSEESYSYNIDASSTFISIFMLLLVGTIIGCPSLAIVDTLTLRLLGDKSYKYGKQRLTGSLGWGLGAFIIGASLTATHKCVLHRRIDLIDYRPCFYAFGVSLAMAAFVCFGFRFDEPPSTDHGNNTCEKNISSIVSSNQKASLLECWQVIKRPTYLYFLFTALLMGFEMAFIKTYLFWHLKDMGACQILFSVISGINCVAEVSMYFFVDRLILLFGQKGVIYLCLGFYAARLFYYAVIPSPWWVVVVELLPGFTTAAAWAACLSYVNAQCTTYFKTTMQCILHSVHWGLGYGLGEVLGGIMVHHFGAPSSFFINGMVCVISLIFYIIIEKCYSQTISNKLEEKIITDSSKTKSTDVSCSKSSTKSN